MDEAYIEELSFDKLKDLVPDELARHWQDVLKFLNILVEKWPEILKAENAMDAVARRVRLFKAQAEIWRETPPDFPVIAAGSTGSQPAIAELLDVIASMKNGTVILPGLDITADEKNFNAWESSHPQYPLKQLLKRMGITRKDVRLFGDQPLKEEQEQRLRLISEAMRPADTTDQWRKEDKNPLTGKAVQGIEKIECTSVREEALAIALIMREVLEEKGKTAALITPNRDLARRVAAEMKRWEITLDDSAGTNLTLTETGAFLLLLGKAALDNWSAVSLVACLKHPMALGGKKAAVFRDIVRELELTLLRGQNLGEGFEGLNTALEELNERLKQDGKEHFEQNARFDRLKTFIADLEERMQRFTELMSGSRAVPFETLLNEHLRAAEQLALSDDRTGEQRLWSEEAGETAAKFLTELKEQSPLIGEVAPVEYLSFLSSLLNGVTVRPKYGMHPRLDILGTIEARLIQPNVLIMGGLNEGVWPRMPEADPWMSRPMRKECGLPSPEMKISLSAHDFAQGFCAENLIITRSLKDGGTPTVPSRWLRRLETVLKISHLEFKKGKWGDWAKKTDKPETYRSIRRPEPKPPVSARPKKLSVTAVETLIRDPYSIYARYILKLKKLDDLGGQADAADLGIIIHKTAEDFCKKHQSSLPDDFEREILENGLRQFEELNLSDSAAAFMKPKLIAALQRFAALQKECADGISKTFCEQDGSYTFKTEGGVFEIHCRADRIDVLNDGTVRLIDYKTGTVPSKINVTKGYSPQLSLETAILEQNGFKDVQNKPVSSFEYWGLNKKGEHPVFSNNPSDIAGKALDDLKRRIKHYSDENNAYPATPNPNIAPSYNDYEHLERYDEWADSFPSEKEKE